MKNIFTVVCLGVFISGAASNGVVKNTIGLDKKTELKKAENLAFVGLCKGSVVVVGSDGRPSTLEMTAVETADALECSRKFLAFVEQQELSYTVISSSSNYNEDGVK